MAFLFIYSWLFIHAPLFMPPESSLPILGRCGPSQVRAESEFRDRLCKSSSQRQRLQLAFLRLLVLPSILYSVRISTSRNQINVLHPLKQEHQRNLTAIKFIFMKLFNIEYLSLIDQTPNNTPPYGVSPFLMMDARQSASLSSTIMRKHWTRASFTPFCFLYFSFLCNTKQQLTAVVRKSFACSTHYTYYQQHPFESSNSSPCSTTSHQQLFLFLSSDIARRRGHF